MSSEASQEILAFYGTRRSLTAFTRARHLSQARGNCERFLTWQLFKIIC